MVNKIVMKPRLTLAHTDDFLRGGKKDNLNKVPDKMLWRLDYLPKTLDMRYKQRLVRQDIPLENFQFNLGRPIIKLDTLVLCSRMAARNLVSKREETTKNNLVITSNFTKRVEQDVVNLINLALVGYKKQLGKESWI